MSSLSLYSYTIYITPEGFSESNNKSRVTNNNKIFFNQPYCNRELCFHSQINYEYYKFSQLHTVHLFISLLLNTVCLTNGFCARNLQIIVEFIRALQEYIFLVRAPSAGSGRIELLGFEPHLEDNLLSVTFTSFFINSPPSFVYQFSKHAIHPW